MDLTNLSFSADSFDAAICIHVLEHIEKDILAINELHRVLKPGGWAIISVPIRLDQKTYEDKSIKTPEMRKQAFGEEGHFRYYGYDFKDRLESSGFEVQVDLGENVKRDVLNKHGILSDENIFYCVKKNNIT